MFTVEPLEEDEFEVSRDYFEKLAIKCLASLQLGVVWDLGKINATNTTERYRSLQQKSASLNLRMSVPGIYEV